ncbi:phosphoribosylformylglycinamidine (FGAM) synthase-like enzyme [Neobacillus niacini]|uniref:hypothetical protein n=1 Tax=Neobacillus niacini TaxID=86668 RepID=UPI00277ED54B|nr:hypothetical protein [Neobacillus niacini]MDQ1005399.1 phosphoribosylformylglycinamidine (FGAM) synthase-like enzyme [Neobacillus niacini]
MAYSILTGKSSLSNEVRSSEIEANQSLLIMKVSSITKLSNRTMLIFIYRM